MSFLLDDQCVTDVMPSWLLLALGGRESVRVYSETTATSGRITFGAPVPGLYYRPVELDGPDGAAGIGVPAYASVERMAAVAAAEFGVDEDRARVVVSLASLVRTSELFDELVLLDECRSGPLGRYARGALSPAEAVALMGLALRANGDFVLPSDGQSMQVLPSRVFYRAVAFAHVSPLADWLGAALGAWQAGDPQPMRLVDGIATRLGRALRARDYLQIRLRAPELKATWEDVLFFFDSVLMQLMGALDLLARLMHKLYGLPEKSYRWASWRRGEWLGQLTEADPDVGALVQPGEVVADTIDLVAELRNHIHEAPLSDESADGGDSPGVLVWGAGVVALPVDGVGQSLVERALRRGGLIRWGISDRSGDLAVVLDPGLFGEQALREAMAAIASVLETADRQRLSKSMPEDLSHWVPVPSDLEALRWLFGLDVGGLRQERATR